jgi:hypothetical protein
MLLHTYYFLQESTYPIFNQHTILPFCYPLHKSLKPQPTTWDLTQYVLYIFSIPVFQLLLDFHLLGAFTVDEDGEDLCQRRLKIWVTWLFLREVTSNALCLVRFYIVTVVPLTLSAFLDLTLCFPISTERSKKFLASIIMKTSYKIDSGFLQNVGNFLPHNVSFILE